MFVHHQGLTNVAHVIAVVGCTIGVLFHRAIFSLADVPIFVPVVVLKDIFIQSSRIVAL